MMKHRPSREKQRELMTEEVEAALHAALRNEGHLFPQTDDEVAELESNLDLSNVPTPDTNKFRQLLDEHTESRIIPLPQANQAMSPAVEENLAAAARNGGVISEEVRRKMAARRAEHEARRAAQKKP